MSRPVDELAERRRAKLETELATAPDPTMDLVAALEEMDHTLVRFLNHIDGELLTDAAAARMFALRLDRLVLDQLSLRREWEAR